MPKISVLMPAYNSGKYIAEAIESILNQTFDDFEFIIINDGSTDNTAQIVNKYAKKDKRIRFIDNKNNQGLIEVLNQGLDMCSGEYIARMDSDDICLPERFKLQVEYMDSNPDVAVVGGWHKKFGINITSKTKEFPQHATLLDMLLKGTPISHPAAMLRRDVLNKHNIRYDKSYKDTEDYQLWVQIAKVAKVCNLQQLLLHYRWHDTNVSILSRATQLQNTKKVHSDIINLLTADADIANILYNLSEETNVYFRLFGILPIIRRKQYGHTKTKYYLFGKLPLLRVQNNKLYLFEFIKIGCLK